MAEKPYPVALLVVTIKCLKLHEVTVFVTVAFHAVTDHLCFQALLPGAVQLLVDGLTQERGDARELARANHGLDLLDLPRIHKEHQLLHENWV